MITVKELINELKKLPPDFTVASYTIFDFDPDNGYSLIDGYAEPYISVNVEKKLVKIEGDCDKEPIESNYAY